jgi:CheY-like chemotaxis protein
MRRTRAVNLRESLFAEEAVMNMAAEAQPKGRVVLVADDNVDAAESLAAWLGACGFRVHVARDGIEAMKLANGVRPHIAVLDIAMPGATGHEVARWIREHDWGRSMRLVALSAWGTEEMRRLSREAGINVHLTKPAAAAEIIHALSSG